MRLESCRCREEGEADLNQQEPITDRTSRTSTAAVTNKERTIQEWLVGFDVSSFRRILEIVHSNIELSVSFLPRCSECRVTCVRDSHPHLVLCALSRVN